MAIGTDAGIDFFGTQDTVTSTSSAVVDAAFSVAGDITAWTNDDDAPMAIIILEATFSVAPTIYTSVGLYARPLNIESTNDADTPSNSLRHVRLGTFPVDDVTTIQRIPIEVALPNWKTSSEYEFYIWNNSGQTMSAGWELFVTPKGFGPHA